ncbi:MAG: hypothetical protein MUE68_13355 [Bacteroidetes bacterium]|jgi:hypothetical protein|nr:hypothetical protein [Bacteroidota bacterium]
MVMDTDLLMRMEEYLRLAGKAEATVEACTGTVRRLARRAGKALVEIEDPTVRGGLDRLVPLSEGTLLMLRKLWKTHRSPLWLVSAATRKGLEHSLEIQATPPRDGRARGDLPPQIPGAAVRPASPPHQVMSRDRAASTLIIVTWLARCGAHPCSCDSLYLTILATSALGIGRFNGNWTDPLANLYAAS